jgi:hypothetical protein
VILNTVVSKQETEVDELFVSNKQHRARYERRKITARYASVKAELTLILQNRIAVVHEHMSNTRDWTHGIWLCSTSRHKQKPRAAR